MNHLNENVHLVEDQESNTGENSLAELNIVHEIKGLYAMDAHELVFVGPGAAIKAERDEQEQDTKHLLTATAVFGSIGLFIRCITTSHEKSDSSDNHDNINVFSKGI